MVLFLFFCSGATALIYELIWSKYLSLMFGSTIWAQTVVLAAFMGGLALGNRWIGARADWLKQPLAAYGYVELVIGLFAFFFHNFFLFADGLFVRWGGPLLEQPSALLLLKAGLAVGLLFIPTILMGGTLPLLVAWLQNQPGETGRRSARFYSINSLGAVSGSFLAGFFLVQQLGLEFTLQMTALGNILIGFTAVALGRKSPPVEPPSAPVPAPAESSGPVRPLVFGCWMVALVGGISMGMEVLAARGLALVFGGSLQAFAIVLITFILGIGLGSSVVASERWKRPPHPGVAAGLLLGTAIWITLCILNIEGMVEIYRHLKSGLAASTTGYRFHQLMAGLISLVVLGIPAGMLGAVLPLWIRILARESGHLGAEVGRLLTWNTLGAVVGVLLTGFVIMPRLGLRGSVTFMAVLLTLLAGGVLLKFGHRRSLGAALAVLVFVSWVGGTGGESWRLVLSSGIFRLRELEVTPGLMQKKKASWKIRYYKDAPDATVSIEQSVRNTNDFSLVVNGKPDASSRGDISTQYLAGQLPLAVRPEAQDVFVLGLGSGMSAGTVLGHPVREVVVAENCAPIIESAAFFAPWNNGVLTDPRTRLIMEDGRTILKLSPRTYDVIISEPSNPWTAGIGSVFTRDFYEISARRLKPGGVFCQWFHTYEMSDAIVMMVLRTFGSVFPHFEVWEPSKGDILILGSLQPFPSGLEQYRQAFARDIPRRQLEEIGILRPEALWSRQLASQKTAWAIPGEGPVQTDFFPVLEYEAPKAFFLGKDAHQLEFSDERTWRMALAPADKQRALAGIETAALQAVFQPFPSVNPELNSYLAQLTLRGDRQELLETEQGLMPVIFRPDHPLPAPAFPVRSWLGRFAAFTNAEAVVLHGETGDGLRQMAAALSQWEISPVTRENEIVARYAEWGVLTALQTGHPERVEPILTAGLKILPVSERLRFLRRFLDGRPGTASP